MKKTLIAAASTAVLLAGCATTEPAEDKQADKKVLHTMESYDLLSVDPADAITSNIFNQIYEGLYRFDANNELVPAAAKSHSVSEDGKVYTFKLDPNAKWSDGKPSQQRTSVMRSSVSSKRTHRSLTCSSQSKKRQRSTTKRSESN